MSEYDTDATAVGGEADYGDQGADAGYGESEIITLQGQDGSTIYAVDVDHDGDAEAAGYDKDNDGQLEEIALAARGVGA